MHRRKPLMMPSCKPSKLGIICGEGDLPSEIIQHCTKMNRPFFLVGFEGQTPPDTIKQYDHGWSQIGQISKTLTLLREAKIDDIVFAGRFRRPGWRELKLDALGFKWISSMMGSVFGDDSLLSTIIKRLEEEEGFRVVSAESITGQGLLMPSGSRTKAEPDDVDWQDIRHGFKIIKKLGDADIGQSVVLQEGLILAVEAIEGTDKLIERTPELMRGGKGPVLVKSIKPNQDARIDRPTIGPETIKKLAASGFKGVALGAGEVIVLHADSVFDLANQLGIFVIGVEVNDE